MRIIIAGAGDVGFHLAKLLALENHDITLIDVDREKLEYISKHLDVRTIKGSSTSLKTLKNANIERTKLLISVTSSEEVNFTTAVLGKRLGAERTVARISNVEFLYNRDEPFMKEIGIDEVISPVTLAAREIKRLITHAALTDHFQFERGKLSLMGIKIEEESPLNGKILSDVIPLSERKFCNVAILRNNETLIPDENSRFHTNDHAYFVACPAGEEKVINLATHSSLNIKRIMILGGSNVGYHASRILGKRYKVKLVDHDRKRCEQIAEELGNVLVINGDPQDIDLLKEEGIEEMDAVIAVSQNSETNIISCLLAKNLGVAKTISLVENIDYIQLSQSVGVDTMINKKLIAANFIFRYIRKGDVLALASIHGSDCEVLEFEVKKGNKIQDKTVGELDFPEGAIIGGVIRRGEGQVPDEGFVFQERDHIVILSKPQCIHQVESYF
ncbi:MAG: Trk system potassium transporter TrkA [Flavobacteriales bacterium]|nr:Trk system potassium transporter TrkA [Flavobacteriales bacterium]